MTLVNWTQSYAEDRGMIRWDFLLLLLVLFVSRIGDGGGVVSGVGSG